MHTLTLLQYQPLAARTAKDMGSTAADLSHAALGIASEIFELDLARAAGDFDNAHEEIGDLMWYVALACTALKLSLHDVVTRPSGMSAKSRELALAGFIGRAKRMAIYGVHIADQDDLDDIAHDLRSVVLYLMKALQSSPGGYTLGQVMFDNVAKLKKRFPQAYSNADAEARADKGGLTALES